VAIDPVIINQQAREYSSRFSLAYSAYMKALGEITSLFSPRLPAPSTEYEYALSQATQSYIRTLVDLRGTYKILKDYYDGK